MAQRKSIKQRRQQQRDAIIQDILSIARNTMKQDGVGALSFNAIARELGIKPPSLYTYFDSKHAIYDMIFRQGFEAFGRAIKENVSLDEPLEVILKQLMVNYMQFAYENPDLFQLMFERPIPHFEPTGESLAVSFELLQESYAFFAELINLKKIKSDITAEEATDMFIVMEHGLTALHMANHPHLPVGEGRFSKIIDLTINMVVQNWETSDQK